MKPFLCRCFQRILRGKFYWVGQIRCGFCGYRQKHGLFGRTIPCRNCGRKVKIWKVDRLGRVIEWEILK